jgi:hypothetical protein
MGLGGTRNLWANTTPRPLDPKFIFAGQDGGATLIHWHRTDQGLHTSGGVVDQWDDLSGNGWDAVGTTTTRPLFTASDSSISGYPSINFAKTGATKLVIAGLNLPAPGTTPTWVFAIGRYRTWTNNCQLIGGVSASRQALWLQPSAAPNMSIISGGTAGQTNKALAINTWGRMEGYFSNGNTDYSMIRGFLFRGPGAGTGNGTATGRQLNGGGTGAATDWDIAEWYECSGTPTLQQFALNARYIGLPDQGSV